MLKFSFINITKYFDLADGSFVNMNLATETAGPPSPQTRPGPPSPQTRAGPETPYILEPVPWWLPGG